MLIPLPSLLLSLDSYLHSVPPPGLHAHHARRDLEVFVRIHWELASKPRLGKRGGEAAERKLHLKYFKSCRALRLDIGPYGSFQRLGALRNMGRIIGYTDKTLVTMKFST